MQLDKSKIIHEGYEQLSDGNYHPVIVTLHDLRVKNPSIDLDTPYVVNVYAQDETYPHVSYYYETVDDELYGFLADTYPPSV